MPMIEKLKEFKTDDNRIVVCSRKVKVTGPFQAEFPRSLCYDPQKLSPHKLLKAEVTVEMTIPHLVKDSSGQVSKRLTYLSFHLIPKEVDAETLVKENFPKLVVTRFTSAFVAAKSCFTQVSWKTLYDPANREEFKEFFTAFHRVRLYRVSRIRRRKKVDVC